MMNSWLKLGIIVLMVITVIIRANLDGSGLETLYTWTGSGHAAIALDLPDNSERQFFYPLSLSKPMLDTQAMLAILHNLSLPLTELPGH